MDPNAISLLREKCLKQLALDSDDPIAVHVSDTDDYRVLRFVQGQCHLLYQSDILARLQNPINVKTSMTDTILSSLTGIIAPIIFVYLIVATITHWDRISRVITNSLRLCLECICCRLTRSGYTAAQSSERSSVASGLITEVQSLVRRAYSRGHLNQSFDTVSNNDLQTALLCRTRSALTNVGYTVENRDGVTLLYNGELCEAPLLLGDRVSLTNFLEMCASDYVNFERSRANSAAPLSQIACASDHATTEAVPLDIRPYDLESCVARNVSDSSSTPPITVDSASESSSCVLEFPIALGNSTNHSDQTAEMIGMASTSDIPYGQSGAVKSTQI